MKSTTSFLIPVLGAAILGVCVAGSGLADAAPTRYKPLAAAKGQSATAQGGAVTFHRDIAPILSSNCSSCHSPGQVGPFPLNSYADAKKRARLIASVTQDRLMPPWHADEGVEKFHGARRLSEAQISLIQRWADAGAPEGKPASTTPAKAQVATQAAPKSVAPDVTFGPPEAYSLSAEGPDVYRCFVIPTNYAEDRWVRSISVAPQNRQVVHHVIAYLDRSGSARKLDEADAGPGYTSFGGPGFSSSGTLGGWAPGNEPRVLPDGTGMLLPKGADIVLQVHYHPNGKPETDLTRIGLSFCQGPVDKRMRVLPVLYLPLRIPAGESKYLTRTEMEIPRDITVHSVTPHMHLLGREMTVSATLPDASTKKMVHVPNWDFNWQTTYAFQQPIALPTGSKVEVAARYDNSTANPINPSSPPKEVRWGEETTDEMCIAFLSYTVDSEHLTRGEVAEGAPDSMGGGGFSNNSLRLLKQLVEMFDENKDGKLSKEESAAMGDFIRKNN
jgi:mono/diheme cytochrome c family protein